MSIKHPEDMNYPPSVLLRKFIGQVSVNDIIDSWNLLEEQGKFSDKTKGVLNDLNGCELDLNMPDFQRLMQYMSDQDHFKGLRMAVVTNSPQQIVFPTLAEMIHTEFTIRPFSTIKAAVDWILE